MVYESVGLMEPLLPSPGSKELSDLVLDLAMKSQALAAMLHPHTQQSIGELVRSMNCYYSNLIEGHDTHPRDIDRALEADYSKEPRKRALQKEAVAHISVQRLIDEGKDPDIEPTKSDYLAWLHREFCGRLPAELLWVENPSGKKKAQVKPGELRDDMVQVGAHVPPCPENLDRFLARFDEAYGRSSLSKEERILAVAAAHHRLLWIHPFFDGNGRVARLLAHAMFKRLGLGSPLWSVARGLARRQADYKAALAAADEPRRDDLDGRGSLSERALVDFCKFFLSVSLDQIEYMKELLKPSDLLHRMKTYVDEEVTAKRLPKGAFALLREAVLSGEIDRGHVAELTGYRERQARTVLTVLIKKDLLVVTGPRSPARLGIPIDVVESWFPALYPTKI